MSARRAFTLLEIAIALGLSLLVILAVYAGIRTAVRSITAVERVALENKMLGFGLLAAVERTDAWDDIDDPTDPTLQPLRVTTIGDYKLRTDTAVGGGLTDPTFLPYDARGADWARIPQPFTPLALSWPQSNPEPGYDPEAYDPDLWMPHVARSWYRGDHVWYGQDDYLDQSQYGNYGIHQAASGRVQVVAGHGYREDLAPWRRWLPDQQLALSYGLGWYGWLDYLPANAMIDMAVTAANGRAYKPSEIARPRSHDNSVTGTIMAGSAPDGNPSTPPSWVVDPNGRGYHGVFAKQRSREKESLYCTGAGQAVTKGWQTWTVHAGISGTEPIVNRSMAGQYRGHGVYSHGHESLNTLPMLLATLSDGRELVEDGPDAWPELTVDVRRFHTWGSPRNHCYLRFTDPISGESRELFFPLTGTTLRGARLARGLDGP